MTPDQFDTLMTAVYWLLGMQSFSLGILLGEVFAI